MSSNARGNLRAPSQFFYTPQPLHAVPTNVLGQKPPVDAVESYIDSVEPDMLSFYPSALTQSSPSEVPSGNEDPAVFFELYKKESVVHLLRTAPNNVLHLSGNQAYNSLLRDYQKVVGFNNQMMDFLRNTMNETLRITNTISADFGTNLWAQQYYHVPPIFLVNPDMRSYSSQGGTQVQDAPVDPPPAATPAFTGPRPRRAASSSPADSAPSQDDSFNALAKVISVGAGAELALGMETLYPERFGRR
ncbi:hypothetical protein B0H15DRAFT_954601 [Mycena belliarum]|uniref:Uncharacterized protein n=1 Tax=Mycena belliarum TaxID=1033014 RepID=A0AAD6TW69_9AGAR|nr:hypothetical protein B0H15DRAFT_954601 [Mycena belliae]